MPFEGEDEMKERKFKKWPEKKTELVEDAEKELIEQIFSVKQLTWEEFSKNDITAEDESGFESMGDSSSAEEQEFDPENPPGLLRIPVGIEFGGEGDDMRFI